MNKIARNNHRESGLVSILAVIMFMIFISIIVIGFIKIMSDEQRQTTDNDLSASALAAAQGGVEDGKRILLHCLSGKGASLGHQNACNDILRSADAPKPCEVFRGGGEMNGLRGALDLNLVDNAGQVGAVDFAQSYTCLTIQSNPTEIEKGLAEGHSEIIPLDVDGDYDSVKIQWKSDASSYGSRPASALFNPRADWKNGSNQLPPVLRVQVIPYTPGAVNVDQSETNSNTMFLVPANSGTVTSVDQSIDNRNPSPGNVRPGLPAAVPVVYAECDILTGYSCKMTITNFDTPANQYYLRLSILYADTTNLRVTALEGGVEKKFEDVQYLIDVTGRANDVYRRIQTRVSPTAPSAYPEFAIDTSLPICKDMMIANLSKSTYCGLSNANPTGQAGIGTPPPGGGAAVACYIKFGWFTQACWQFRPSNLTDADQADIASCTWNWGDGDIFTYPGTHAFCKPCDTSPCPTILHDYDPVGPVGTRRKFIVKLTVNINGGSSTTATTTIWRPR